MRSLTHLGGSMKHILLVLFIFAGWLSSDIFCQASFETGLIGVNLSNGGRLRILAPTSATRQIDRSSVLVGKNSTQVFDYTEDGEVEDTAISITTTFADFAIYGSTNNTYNDPPLPPNVLSKIWVYGWNNQAYLITKITVVNRETDAFSAVVGMEVIPQLDGSYGNEVVNCDLSENLLYTFKPNAYVGYKVLGESMKGYDAFDWFEGYNTDSSFWHWLNKPAANATFQSGGDGAVAIFAKEGKTIANNDSVTLYIAIAYGTSETEMRTNIASAVAKYNTLVSVYEPSSVVPEKFELNQNFPNPFNPNTTISYNLPNSGYVSLKIYDILGNEVATLVNENMEAGKHSIDFSASNIVSGIYFYKLDFGSKSQIKKMTLLK